MDLNCCTFLKTGQTKTVQFYKTCYTCFSRPNLGACLNCIAVCHDGHDVGPLQVGEIFCTCGNHNLCKFENFVKDGVIIDRPKAPHKKQKTSHNMDSLDMLPFDDNPMLFEHQDEDEDFLNDGAAPTAAKDTKKNGRAKKDPNAPKGPLSSFMVYSIEARSVLHKENPALTMIELSRLIGDNWKNMDPAQREEFELRGKADRDRYAAEMVEYKKNIELGIINPGSDINSKGSSQTKPKNVGPNGKRAYNRKPTAPPS